MEIKIRSIHLDTTERLEAFIEKKVGKLEKTSEDIRKVEVQLKLIKSATALDKWTAITVVVPGGTLLMEKTYDTFEEGIDLCVGAMRIQISKYKGKMQTR